MNDHDLSAPFHEDAMKILQESAATISKRGKTVLLNVETHEEANALFDWLTEIGLDNEGSPVGWKIIATGNDGGVLCEAPNGQRRMYWFLGKPKEERDG